MRRLDNTFTPFRAFVELFDPDAQLCNICDCLPENYNNLTIKIAHTKSFPYADLKYQYVVNAIF